MSPYNNAGVAALCAQLGIDSQIIYDEEGRPVVLPDTAGLMRLRNDALCRGQFAFVAAFDELIWGFESL